METFKLSSKTDILSLVKSDFQQVRYSAMVVELFMQMKN